MKTHDEDIILNIVEEKFHLARKITKKHIKDYSTETMQTRRQWNDKC